MIGTEPDLTFIIDMDPATRAWPWPCPWLRRRPFEDFGLGFQETIRHGFLALAHDHPNRCVVIDGNRDIAAISTEVIAPPQPLAALTPFPQQAQPIHRGHGYRPA